MDLTPSELKILTLIAISGECSPDALPFLGISSSYTEKLITELRRNHLIKIHTKDQLKGYRITNRSKQYLLNQNPLRFSFYLTGNSDTNRPRSDYPRRLRLHHASIVYAFFISVGVALFRDEKPDPFDPVLKGSVQLSFPTFYHSRELKMLGDETIKINNSRSIGILLCQDCIYSVFFTEDHLMKWEYRTELRLRTLLTYHLNHGVLKKYYYHFQPQSVSQPVKALILGSSLDTALKMMTSSGGYQKSYFQLDSSFDHYHYVPLSESGRILIQLLQNPEKLRLLQELMLSDLSADHLNIYPLSRAGKQLLLAFDFDMLAITRFYSMLSLQDRSGHIICFDFQKIVLQQYFGVLATFETIDLAKYERSFSPESTQKT